MGDECKKSLVDPMNTQYTLNMNRFDSTVELGLLDEKICRLANSDLETDWDQLRLLKDERKLIASIHPLKSVDVVIGRHVTVRATIIRKALDELDSGLLMLSCEKDKTVALLVRSEIKDICVHLQSQVSR